VILSEPNELISLMLVESLEPKRQAPFRQNFSEIVVQASSPGRDNYWLKSAAGTTMCSLDAL
jgi:hypothetical protein